MNISDIAQAHFIGVSGIGVSALLRYFAKRGVKISGSDVALPPPGWLPTGEYADRHDAENVPEHADIVIYSPAVPKENPERRVARERGIPEYSYPEALAFVTRPYNTIAVSGTHGKSTTTALLGKLFAEGGLDPSVIVGAEAEGFDHNLRVGGSDLFIVEACEYRRNMLNLSPQTIVLTNLELDHPDYYVDLADIKNAFREYIAKLSGEDLLIMNNDDANLRDITANFDGIIVRFGVSDDSDLQAKNIRARSSGQSFELYFKGTLLGNFETTLPGLYNIYNILAGVATFLAYGGNPDVIQKTLSAFTGVGRRFEEVGKLGSAIVISDYAHHPTALSAVSEGARTRFPEKRILTVFRPHHRERVIKLYDHFVKVLSETQHLLLVEIYDVAGREDVADVGSEELLRSVYALHPNADAVFAKDLSSAEEFIRAHGGDFDVILVIGAGDADQLAKKLVA